MKVTNHDYQHCLVGNYFSNDVNGRYESWEEFKRVWLGFVDGDKDFEKYDDTYHFLFRYDINQYDDDPASLELCFMLQRKGIYSHIYVDNLTEEELNNEIPKWLKGRKQYLDNLWKEVAE